MTFYLFPFSHWSLSCPVWCSESKNHCFTYFVQLCSCLSVRLSLVPVTTSRLEAEDFYLSSSWTRQLTNPRYEGHPLLVPKHYVNQGLVMENWNHTQALLSRKVLTTGNWVLTKLLDGLRNGLYFQPPRMTPPRIKPPSWLTRGAAFSAPVTKLGNQEADIKTHHSHFTQGSGSSLHLWRVV